MSRILVRGGRLLDVATGLESPADILVEGDRVVRIEADIADDAADVVNAAGCLVLSGFVDLHTHLREPGFEHKGTIASETLAAARGGFTTVCAMPNTDPPPDNAATVESLLDRIQRTAAVRVLPIGCVTRGRHGAALADLDDLAQAGCVAYSDDGDHVAEGIVMRRALEIAGDLGLPISEHSEDPVLKAGGVMNEGPVSERLGLPGAPAASETVAITRNIALAELTGAHLHIAHLSTRRGVELVADAKARGIRVTAEVTPSHLFLTDAAVFGAGPEPAYDTLARINPPLRSEDDRRALLQGLMDGTIDAIATDHAPHAVTDKQCEFEDAAPGISCLETALGTILTLVQRGELSLARAIEALTAGPAQVFNLDARVPGIGRLRKGGPADLVVVDPSASWTVEPAEFASRGKNTPLAGVELTGRVSVTIAGGRIAHSTRQEGTA